MDIDRQSNEEILRGINAYLRCGGSRVAVLGNLLAALMTSHGRISWCGFYLVDEQARELHLDVFHGPPTAHTIIPFGEGICGMAVEKRETIYFGDVKTNPRYIACDPLVRCEAVLPILVGERIVAVLDIDSYQDHAFEQDDLELFESCAKMSAEYIER